MPQTDIWTIGRLLAWTTGYLQEHGAETPRLDAEILLAEALGRRRIDLYTAFDDVPGEKPRTAFRELIRRRAQGEPVAYLVGRREFYSLSFRVTRDVLIPRPETELLVVTLLDLARLRTVGEPLAIADVGTGSGVIAVCAAKHLPACRVTAVDISAPALAVARANARDHDVERRIEFFQSDLLTGVPDERRFDFVVSNPPYVGAAEMETLAIDVRKYEPRVALEAGDRATEVIERLVSQAAERLKCGGYLLMEISPTIHDAARAVLETDDRLELAETIKDLSRQPRVVQARRK